ncbi:MAG: glycosyltransferase [Candidatus Lernaella stagnicola]|nr:glycosyltransferase [Candidatus Lernaella stagnicola]
MNRILAVGPDGTRRRLRQRQFARAEHRGWRRVDDEPLKGGEPGRPIVTHVIPWDLTTGGIQRMVSQWCQHTGLEWDVHVVSPGIRGAYEFPNATVHPGLSDDACRSFLDETAPDLLVHHGPSVIYGRFTDCPVVWVVHNELVFADAKPTWCRPRAILSNYPPDNLGPNWQAAEITAIPLGVDLSVFRPRRLIAGIAGRVSPEKIPPAFIDALLAWGNPDRRWTVRFVGMGLANSYQSVLEKRVSDVDWIEFAGDVPPSDMPEHYQAMDVLMVPSIRESGSYVIVEALACGVPVVARRVGGVPFNTNGAAPLVDEDQGFIKYLNDTGCEHGSRVTAAREIVEAETRHDIGEHVRHHDAEYRRALSWPDFDVLMPVRDTPANWLRAAFFSVYEQSHRPRMIVLVDDGSTDPETIQTLDGLVRRPHVTLLRFAKNRGIAEALNEGLRHCASDFVARMDADDLSMPQRFAKQARHLARHSDVDVLGGQIEWFDRSGQTHHPAIVTANQAARSNWFLNHPTVVFRRSCVLDVGGYPDEPVAQDFALWLKLLKRGAVIHNLPEPLVRYRVHDGQLTARGEHASAVNKIRRERHG